MYRNLQHYRHTAHLYLDPIWQMSSNKSKARSSLYNWLATQMGLPIEDTHISKFNREQCKQAIQLLRQRYIQLFGHDLPYEIRTKPKTTTISKNFNITYLAPDDNTFNGSLYGRLFNAKLTYTGDLIDPVLQETLEKAVQDNLPNRHFIYSANCKPALNLAKAMTKYDIPSIKLPAEVDLQSIGDYILNNIQEQISKIPTLNFLKFDKILLTALDNNECVELIKKGDINVLQTQDNKI